MLLFRGWKIIFNWNEISAAFALHVNDLPGGAQNLLHYRIFCTRIPTSEKWLKFLYIQKITQISANVKNVKNSYDFLNNYYIRNLFDIQHCIGQPSNQLRHTILAFIVWLYSRIAKKAGSCAVRRYMFVGNFNAHSKLMSDQATQGTS